MFTNFNYAFRTPPHAHELDNGRTVRLTEMEQRELDRLHLKLGQISDKALAFGMRAGGEATAPTEFVTHLIETLIMEIGIWMLSVDLEAIVKDDAMSQTAPKNQALLDMVGQLHPSEAKLLRDSICHNGELWRGLCKLSPSVDLNPLPPIRTEQYNAMRFRFLSWINTLQRALPTPSVHDTAPQAELPACKPTPQQVTLVATVAQQMSRIHDGGELGADIAPHLVVTLPGWPKGRPLQVLSVDGQKLQAAGPGPSPGKETGKEPVTVLVDRTGGKHWGVCNGRRVPTPAVGDSFYRALLTSLTVPERSALLESVGGDPSDAFGDASMTSLREATRQQLAGHPEQFGPLLELLQLKKTAAQR